MGSDPRRGPVGAHWPTLLFSPILSRNHRPGRLTNFSASVAVIEPSAEHVGMDDLHEPAVVPVLHRATLPVLVQGPRMTSVQMRARGSSTEPDRAAIGPEATAQGGVSDEWHLDLEKTVTMEKLGSYPAC